MNYQLPSGKVIYLSTEAYLSMSDEELKQLNYSGSGENPSYSGSYAKKVISTDAETVKPAEIDYTPESDDLDTVGPIDINALPEE